MYNGKRFLQYENEKLVPLKIQKIFHRLNMISIMLIQHNCYKTENEKYK